MATDTQPFTVRQSHLSTFARCPLSAKFAVELDTLGDWHSPQQARGVLFHRVAAEILRRLKAEDMRRVPLTVAFAVMEEVLAQVDAQPEDVLVVGPEQRAEIKSAVWGFAQLSFDMKRLMPVGDVYERRLWTTIPGPDGVERVLTGQPDAVFAMPPGGAQIRDWKTSYAPPKEPRQDPVTDAKRYLSERGLMQLDSYGVLVMDNFDAVQRVALREDHVMSGEFREAVLERDELEDVRERLGEYLMLFDRAQSEGDDSAIWAPIGGRWCSWCAGRLRCPRPLEDRGEGAILDLPMAEEYAQDVVASEAKRKHQLGALKAYVDANGPVPLPDGRQYGWESTEQDDGKVSRRFVPHVPSE